MHNMLRRAVAAGMLIGMCAGSAALAQTVSPAGGGSIVVLTNQNEADVVNDANNVPILAAIGAPAFFAAHRAELTTIASAHKRTLLVVYADPSTINDADQIVAQLTNGDTGYPMVLYLGNETRKLKGTITQGQITTLVNAELRR